MKSISPSFGPHHLILHTEKLAQPHPSGGFGLMESILYSPNWFA